MAFKKTMKSEAPIVVGNGDENLMYPKGYSYMLGDMVFTVLKESSDGPTQMRQLMDASGSVEWRTVESIKVDHDMTKNGGVPVKMVTSKRVFAPGDSISDEENGFSEESGEK